jgi:hypothetical protein
MKPFLLATTLALAFSAALGHEGARHTGGIASKPATTDQGVLADFDIVHTRISTENNIATFHMSVSGKAGDTRPTATGHLAGSSVFSYVWPTTIDPFEVGFEHGPVSWRWPSLRIRISTTPCCMTRMVTASATMTATFGTVTGWC